MSFHEGLISILKCEHGKTHAIVFVSQIDNGVLFQVFCKGLKQGKKCFSLHERGNLTSFFDTLGPPYNPDGEVHGNINAIHSRRGDLGNVIIDSSGNCEMNIVSYKLNIEEILGRSLVIYSNEDDLTLCNNDDPLLTENSRKPVCCGVIGFQ